ncbi:MAG: UDP-3-O-acyl-N-acetylglucosamine deacetylase [Chlamydiota bacterium]
MWITVLFDDQCTIANRVSVSGTGLFTGSPVHLQLRPASPGKGIFFRRKDCPKSPIIEAHLANVSSTFRSTCLEHEGIDVLMVEHLLSALSAFGIDNVEVVLDNKELPCGDGSARIFTELLEKAGKTKQSAPRKIYAPQDPIYWSEGETQVIALPSDRMQVSYLLHYPNVSLLDGQYHTFMAEEDSYCKEIAPARTFALDEEVRALIAKGYFQEASLQNGILIRGSQIVNPEGLRFPNEMARHKILDLLGDLMLLGRVKAHIIGIRSGHKAHVAFARKLQESMEVASCAS